jgi:hypothetical protein
MTNFDVPNAFSQLPWHDAELLEIRVGHGNGSQRVVNLDVAFSDSDLEDRRQVQFNDARGIQADVDLLAKELCGNQISGVRCDRAETSTDNFVKTIQERFDLYQGETVKGLFLFSVHLIHPDRTITILARSFSVDRVP